VRFGARPATPEKIDGKPPQHGESGLSQPLVRGMSPTPPLGNEIKVPRRLLVSAPQSEGSGRSATWSFLSNSASPDE